MPEPDRFKDLLELLLSNRISSAQLQELNQMMDDPAFTKSMDAVLQDSYYLHADTTEDSIENALLYQEKLRQKMSVSSPRTSHIRRLAIRWAAAAIIVLSLGGAAWIYIARKASQPVAAKIVSHFGGDVQPGKNKALLTLGDQTTVTLDDQHNGEINSRDGARILQKGNALVYGPDSANHTTVIYNTVTTPAGGQFQLVLADGTAVWLDSRSSIRYPVAFNDNSRDVSITGQVYFEVKPQSGKPFNVKVKDQVINVLGTRFNVNAFDNEPRIRTTLAEGAVRVRLGDKELLLHPAEQAASDDKGGLDLVAHPDMEETLAWKNGLFHFNGSDIVTIMRQMTRWYDVEIEYKDEIKASFVADIPRDVPLSQVLQLLELTGHVHFHIDGKKIIVSK